MNMNVNNEHNAPFVWQPTRAALFNAPEKSKLSLACPVIAPDVMSPRSLESDDTLAPSGLPK
jgi:hypothetical protein